MDDHKRVVTNWTVKVVNGTRVTEGYRFAFDLERRMDGYKLVVTNWTVKVSNGTRVTEGYRYAFDLE